MFQEKAWKKTTVFRRHKAHKFLTLTRVLVLIGSHLVCPLGRPVIYEVGLAGHQKIYKVRAGSGFDEKRPCGVAKAYARESTSSKKNLPPPNKLLRHLLSRHPAPPSPDSAENTQRSTCSVRERLVELIFHKTGGEWKQTNARRKKGDMLFNGYLPLYSTVWEPQLSNDFLLRFRGAAQRSGQGHNIARRRQHCVKAIFLTR